MRLLLWLMLAGACAVVGYAIGHGPRRPDLSRQPVAHVNGQPVTRAELQLQLQSFSPQAMEQLVQLKLLRQEAERLKLPIDRENSDSQQLLRAIILQAESESGLHQVYTTCKRELTRYDCWVMLFADEESQNAALDQLAHGGDFAQVARAYSQDQYTHAKGGHLERTTLPELRSRYGPYLAEQAEIAPLNRVSRTVSSPYGPMIVLVKTRKDSFRDLRSDCEKVLVQARTTALLARLTQAAVVGP